MGLDSIADFATEAFDVASETLTDGAEFLSDGFKQLQEQIGDFAGNADWFTSNFPGDILPTDTTTLTSSFNFESLTSSFPSEFPNLTGSFPSVDSLSDYAGSLADKAKDAASGAFDSIKANADSLVTKLESQFTTENISKFATKTLDSVVTQAQNTAVNLAKNAANQALSTVVGPAAAATLTNGAANAFNGPPTKGAKTVNPTSNPTVPSGYQNEAQQAADGNGDAPVSPLTNPQAAQSDDVAKLNADGSVDLSQFNKGPTQLPTNYTGEAVSLLTEEQKQAADNPIDAPSPTNAGLTSRTNPDGSVTTTDDDGSTITTYPDGRVTSTPAPADDPNAATRSLAAGNNNTINSTAGTVADPNLAIPPINSTIGTAASQVLTTAASRAQGLIRQAQNQQTARLQRNTPAQAGDWRVRLSLAPNSNYLYNATPNPGPVLWPLYNTGGVIFPYTPTIDTSYRANYSAYDLTHSNYRGYFYQNSYIDGINIKATFTAQDTSEANYLLAVIHFFKSVTKMFYGQDAQRGSPPPLVFLSGLGDFQFNQHPCVVSQFNYNLPADVNYIRAQTVLNNGTNQLNARMRQTTLGNPVSNAIQRLTTLGQGILPGAVSAPFSPQGSLPANNPTYVPTKMDISLTLLPVQSRSQVSQQFSLAGFANGNLLKGGFW
jgi:hypothetical protein